MNMHRSISLAYSTTESSHLAYETQKASSSSKTSCCPKCDVRIFTSWNWDKSGRHLRCKLVTHNKQISKLPYVGLFQILSAMSVLNIIWSGLQFGKLSQKRKGRTFYWDTVYVVEFRALMQAQKQYCSCSQGQDTSLSLPSTKQRRLSDVAP